MPLNISRIQAICFDVDGTLRDTDDQMVARMTAVLGRFPAMLLGGSPAELARRLVMKMERPGNLLQAFFDRLGFDQHFSSLLDDFSGGSAAHRSGAQSMIIGVPEMLASLSSRYPLAVVSASSARASQVFLEMHQLSRFFKVVVTGGTCRRTKPHPEPVLYAARFLGVPPESCLMVGDTTVDIRAGRSAGAQTVGVLCGFGEPDELARAGADLILAATPLLMDCFNTAGDNHAALQAADSG